MHEHTRLSILSFRDDEVIMISRNLEVIDGNTVLVFYTTTLRQRCDFTICVQKLIANLQILRLDPCFRFDNPERMLTCRFDNLFIAIFVRNR